MYTHRTISTMVISSLLRGKIITFGWSREDGYLHFIIKTSNWNDNLADTLSKAHDKGNLKLVSEDK